MTGELRGWRGGALLIGALAFWTGIGAGVMRPSEPHPGLRDNALKSALRQERDHRPLSYAGARSVLFGKVDGDGRRATCRYTGEQVRYIKQPLPNKALVEHAWSITRAPAEARSDLHQMWVAIPQARAARANLHYGRVTVALWERGGSKAGPSSRLTPVFEVRPEERGDVARAMFYVSTMYGEPIPGAEEAALRAWHEADPVSKGERARNERVARAQRSRNPFIDHPRLTERIADF